MKLNESYVRKKVLEVTKKDLGLFAFPIESGLVHEGIPDVCTVRGRHTFWIELKYVPDFPKRPDTLVCSTLLRPSQIVWLAQYNEQDADNGWILVRVRNAYFCFSSYLSNDINSFVQQDYYEKCLMCGSAKNPNTLSRIIRGIVYRLPILAASPTEKQEARDSFNSHIPEGMF